MYSSSLKVQTVVTVVTTVQVLTVERNLATEHIWVKMPRKNNGLIDVLNLLCLAAYCGQLQRSTVGFYLDEMPTRVTRYI